MHIGNLVHLFPLLSPLKPNNKRGFLSLFLLLVAKVQDSFKIYSKAKFKESFQHLRKMNRYYMIRMLSLWI